jgi:hypothetical protein
MPLPLSPMRTSSRQSNVSSSVLSPQFDSFAHEAHKRHELFVQRESNAANDEERVRLFAEFVVTESRIRRDRYAGAIDAMGSEVLELTRDLFRPYTASQRHAVSTSTTSYPAIPASRTQTHIRNLPPLQTPDSAPSSASSLASNGQIRPESTWWNDYRPSLSPIASMTADESSSRGRPSSRWWEVGESGGGSPTATRQVLERSKRESKYMGIPKTMRENPQWDDHQGTPQGRSTPSVDSSHGGQAAGPSTNTSYTYGPNEYPPEKVGWHEGDALVSPPYKTPTSHLAASSNAGESYSPSPGPPLGSARSTKTQTNPHPASHLDISRLVTLPPPYPRHHPAVNNSHPDLATLRVNVRSLTDFTEVRAMQTRFTEKETKEVATEEAEAASRKQDLRARIHTELESGKMTYADAAQEEEAFKRQEAETRKQNSRTRFEAFQSEVVAPVNEVLMHRVSRAQQISQELESDVRRATASENSDDHLEEGDEKPELLEKLTLLKWVFEAREALEREVYELLSERNDRYRDVVILPYELAGRKEKVGNARGFFEEDARRRRKEFDAAVLQRTEAFEILVEGVVIRGVEIQEAAFWDIAPRLSELLDSVPKDLFAACGSDESERFSVVVPQEEYDEDPRLEGHPLRYLWTLLGHGKRSTYQFVEGQVNLLCLMHEVKEAVLLARARVTEGERIDEMEMVMQAANASRHTSSSTSQTPESEAEQEAQAAEVERLKREIRDQVGSEREAAEEGLTADLKEKVRCVEELWESALGREMDGVLGRVREFLEETGGWEGLDEE